ncbi:hypothetical protein BGS_0283 [Beggiatoa sp. SS]|nr:hypothetical protein BGS_0283 [Beggiatoa sp. SS]
MFPESFLIAGNFKGVFNITVLVRGAADPLQRSGGGVREAGPQGFPQRQRIIVLTGKGSFRGPDVAFVVRGYSSVDYAPSQVLDIWSQWWIARLVEFF